MNNKDIMTDYGNLYRAYKKAKNGKKFNGSTARFQSMALEGVHLLKEQLENKTYSVGKYSEFKIYEPKERVIKSCTFKDKVVQHCLCDNILHPKLQNRFIECNYAGQIGKGTLFGMEKLKEHMLSHFKQNGATGWILKCDISKFFYSIDHQTVKDIVDYYFTDEYTQWLNHLYIDSTESPGLPLGNQVAQVYALLMLDGLEHFITGELGIEHYGRYMDDFYLLHSSKEYLKYCLYCINEMVSTLNLSLNGKTQIMPFKNGIKFLGFHHYVTKDGKYIRKLTGENKRKARKRIRSMTKQVKNGNLGEEKFKERYNSWKNHAMHGNCYKLCRSMDKFVNELMNGETI